MSKILQVKDQSGRWIEITAIKGDAYVLTEEDKREIAEMVYALAMASNVPSQASLEDDAGYITADDLRGYALKTDIPTVPTKVSAFTNDAGYLTETQVQQMIEDAIANIPGGENEEAVIISFSIENYQFQAEQGMTWREWVNSEYNSDGVCVYNEGADTIRFVEYSLDVLSPSNTPVKGSDSIISGYFYYLS